MITKILTFKNGHFYDMTTKERLEIKEGIEFSITCAENDDFYKARPAGTFPLESHIDVLEQIQNDSSITKYKKIFSAGKTLYFAITRMEDDLFPIVHEFEVDLKQDLYFYYNKSWKLKEYRLYDCHCQLVGNPSNTIDFFEYVYGKSLNELYKNTFVHYFGNKGNPASNALDRFYEKKPNGKQIFISYYREAVEIQKPKMFR